jgi:hypothetical protein
MSAADLPTEALALAWAVQVGAVNWEGVVAWADGWLLRLDESPEELLDLSLSARRPDEALTLLRRLAQRGDPDAALSALARRLLDGLRDGTVQGAVLAEHLESLRFLSLAGVPDGVRLPAPPKRFLDAAHHLWFLLEPWNLDFTPDVTAEVSGTLHRFL